MKRIGFKNLMLIQMLVIIFTLSQVLLKITSGVTLLSVEFFLLYGAVFVLLFIYAIFWQQTIKRVDLTVAYINKAIALLWALLWSVLIFKEEITLGKVLGVLVVLAGLIVINGDKKKGDK